MRVWPEFTERAIDPLCLQRREPERQGLSLRRHIEEALTAILLALPLQHITLIDELLEHAAERLFRDVEDLEQIRNLHAGVAVDEMQHPMMRPPETKFQKHLVGVADEVTVGKKQQFDDVPNGLRRSSARRTALCHPRTGHGDLAHIYVSHIDIFCFYVTKTVPETKGSYQKDPLRVSLRELLTASFRVGQVIPGVTG